MKKSALVCFLSVSFVLIGTLHPKEPIYESDFGESRTGWSGRAGYEGIIYQPQTDVDPKNPGKPVLRITAGGTLGAGYFFTCPAEVEVGREYELTFWVLCTGDTGLAARICVAGEDDYGEEEKSWFTISEKPNRWYKVERKFFPTVPRIGLEIGAKEEEYAPCDILIKDVVIKPR